MSRDRPVLMTCALALSACATPNAHPRAYAPPAPAVALPPEAAPPAPPRILYLYGSGEAATISLQAWRAMVRYTADQVRARPADSVILAPGATLAAPTFVPCGDKPLAAVFDIDETVLLNLGFEYDAATGTPYSDAHWREWEKTGAGKVAAAPGAAKALAVLREIGVKVIFNGNRLHENAAHTADALDRAGLGPAVEGDTLFLAADQSDAGKLKDGRRAAIAARYCVIAMAGDQLGDFSDLFNAGLDVAPRRAAALAAPVARLWGSGWFMLPNPVYGPAIKGGIDDIFPPAAHWSPEASPQTETP